MDDRSGYKRISIMPPRYVAFWLRIITVSLSLVPLVASILCAQERPPAGQVNTEHSRVYIFVDKIGVVGHQHAIEGKLASGNLFLSGASNGALVFNMKTFDADTITADLQNSEDV